MERTPRDMNFINQKSILEMNEFTKAELEGRSLFEGLLQQQGVTKYKFTEHPYDRIDCVFKKKHHWIVEIKVRNQEWDSLFMERSKYEAMNKMKLDKGMYVNFIGDKCYIFSLKTVQKFIRDCVKQNLNPYKWVYANKTTAIDSGKEWKQMIDLPKGLASCLILKEGKWYAKKND